MVIDDLLKLNGRLYDKHNFYLKYIAISPTCHASLYFQNLYMALASGIIFSDFFNMLVFAQFLVKHYLNYTNIYSAFYSLIFELFGSLCTTIYLVV